MNDLITSEPIVRFSAFAATAALLVVGERLRPCRGPRQLRQYFSNIGLLVTNTVLLRIVAVSSLVGIGTLTQSAGWGVLALTQLPGWIEFIIAFMALDLVVYLLHRGYHWRPILWRLHRVHHTDLEFDTSTGIRFHPGEMLLSFAIKAAAVVVLGASPVAVLCFELVLSSASLFTHANLKLPLRADAALRMIVVTPDMHRIHHSVNRDEHNRNFGFFLSCWDYAFRSYKSQPRGGHAAMQIGLAEFRDAQQHRYLSLLKQPFLTAC